MSDVAEGTRPTAGRTYTPSRPAHHPPRRPDHPAPPGATQRPRSGRAGTGRQVNHTHYSISWIDTAPASNSTGQHNPPDGSETTPADTGTDVNPFRFQGGYYDTETGMLKFGTRYYQPALGRWTQGDPVSGTPSPPTSWNTYGFASDEPVTGTDPDGRFDLGSLLDGLGAWDAAASIVTLSAVWAVPLIEAGGVLAVVGFASAGLALLAAGITAYAGYELVSNAFEE